MNQLPVFTHSTPKSTSVIPSRITQWIIGKNDFGQVDYRNLLLPMLAWQTHHNDQRWITWVASQFIDKPTLERFGVNLSSLRMIVDSHSTYSSFKLLLTALKNNRSSMVIASLPSLSGAELAELESAARLGDCSGLILIHPSPAPLPTCHFDRKLSSLLPCHPLPFAHTAL